MSARPAHNARAGERLGAIAALGMFVMLCACAGDQPAPRHDPIPAYPTPATHETPSTPPEVAQPADAHAHAAEPAGMRLVFPHVRVDVQARVVEVDGFVPIDVNDPDAPDVYLELIACSPDTREHESLVVTAARPSHVHAALLMIGLQPGKPGAWAWDGEQFTYEAPEGDAVRVDIRYVDGSGAVLTSPAWSWVRAAHTGEPFPSREWVFAGSREVERQGRVWYDADGAGTLIGLCTFESETIAWPEVISHEAAVHEPVWTANNDRVPPFGTRATLALRPGAASE